MQDFPKELNDSKWNPDKSGKAMDKDEEEEAENFKKEQKK